MDTESKDIGIESPEFGACSTSVVEAEPVAPAVHVLLDRSQSMTTSAGVFGTRMDAARSGVATLINGLPDDSVVGVTLFPSLDNSTILQTEADYTSPFVAPAPIGGARDEMIAMLRQVEPAGGTPLGCAYPPVLSSMKDAVVGGSRIVVVVTDGTPGRSCIEGYCQLSGNNDFAGCTRNYFTDHAANASQASESVRTFVVGVADGDVAGSRHLTSDVAEAGRTPRYDGCGQGKDCFHELRSETFGTDLERALDQVASNVRSCTFSIEELENENTDRSLVNVELVDSDGSAFTRPRDADRQAGWDYQASGSAVEIYGGECERIIAGETQVSISLGCETVLL